MALQTVHTTVREPRWTASGCGSALLPAHTGRPRALVAEDDLRVLLRDELRRSHT